MTISIEFSSRCPHCKEKVLYRCDSEAEAKAKDCRWFRERQATIAIAKAEGNIP